MHPIVKGLLARVASLVPSAVATLLASRLILEHYGVDVFNTYVLVFSTMVLIPLNDLGAGAAVTSAVASDGARHPQTRRVTLTAARTLSASGIVLAAVALGISAADRWEVILGDGAYATGAFGVAIAAYGLSFVPGIGQSALLGANKNHLTIVVQGFLAPAMCAGAGAAVLFDLDPFWVVVVPGLSVLVISLVNAWVGGRVTGLRLLPLVPRLLRRRRHPGGAIRGIAGPALIMSLTAPVALQSQRLVLSHFGTSQDVANYSVALQLFGPIIALIPAAARPLWPMFTQARTAGTRPPNLFKITMLFVALTALGSAPLVLLADPLGDAIGGERIDLGLSLPIATALATMFQAVAIPLAMALMYPAGLRLMSRMSLLAMPINIGLACLVAPHLGAPGPLYAGLVVAVSLQIVPAVVHLRRHGIGTQSTASDPAAPAPVGAVVGAQPVPVDPSVAPPAPRADAAWAFQLLGPADPPAGDEPPDRR